MSHPDGANGARLKEIRLAAGFNSIDKASEECNRLAESIAAKVEPFTPKKLRRFESIGVIGSYGLTPPTYSEINIMMRVYSGSLAYLFLGLPPVVFPEHLYEQLISACLDQKVIEHVTLLGKLPKSQRDAIIDLVQLAAGSGGDAPIPDE